MHRHLETPTLYGWVSDCRQSRFSNCFRINLLFCFSGDRCGRKTPYKRKPPNKAVFKGTWVVLAGVECSPKIIRFSANGIPAKRVATLSTLSHLPFMGGCCFVFTKRTYFLFIRYSLKCSSSFVTAAYSIIFFIFSSKVSAGSKAIPSLSLRTINLCPPFQPNFSLAAFGITI